MSNTQVFMNYLLSLPSVKWCFVILTPRNHLSIPTLRSTLSQSHSQTKRNFTLYLAPPPPILSPHLLPNTTKKKKRKKKKERKEDSPQHQPPPQPQFPPNNRRPHNQHPAQKSVDARDDSHARDNDRRSDLGRCGCAFIDRWGMVFSSGGRIRSRSKGVEFD